MGAIQAATVSPKRPSRVVERTIPIFDFDMLIPSDGVSAGEAVP
jgi:hypothetical protein